MQGTEQRPAPTRRTSCRNQPPLTAPQRRRTSTALTRLPACVFGPSRSPRHWLLWGALLCSAVLALGTLEVARTGPDGTEMKLALPLARHRELAAGTGNARGQVFSLAFRTR